VLFDKSGSKDVTNLEPMQLDLFIALNFGDKTAGETLWEKIDLREQTEVNIACIPVSASFPSRPNIISEVPWDTT